MLGNVRKKFIGDKQFYKMVLAIAIPIMIQNGITNFVSLLDNIMVGQIGTEQMSGVAIVNQLIFVYNLCICGGVSGAKAAPRVSRAHTSSARLVLPAADTPPRMLTMPRGR